MPDPRPRGVLSNADIARSKQEALDAFYRHRSESLRGSNTTAGPGSTGTPPAPKPQPVPKRRRPGILGYVADAFSATTGQ